jgi:hypothetical protein
VERGGSAVYDLLQQKQIELQINHLPAERFIELPYFHPPYYTLLIAPLASLSYRNAYYAMSLFDVVLTVALIVLLVRHSLAIHGRGAVVAAALIAGFFPLFVTVLQGWSRWRPPTPRGREAVTGGPASSARSPSASRSCCC